MNRVNLTQYDEIPRSMANYLRFYGPHFNKSLHEFAVSRMYKKSSGEKEYINPYTKEQVKEILERYGITLKYNQLYDFVYVANMCKADFLGSSIQNEEGLAKYVKDVIDDEDAYDGIVFNRWYADMSYTGVAINWEDFLQ